MCKSAITLFDLSAFFKCSFVCLVDYVIRYYCSFYDVVLLNLWIAVGRGESCNPPIAYILTSLIFFNFMCIG